MIETLTPDVCRGIVLASVAHLLRLIRPDGRFVYAHPMGRPDLPLPGYNMLRHCGTLWFLLRAVNDLQPVLDCADRSRLDLAVRRVLDRLERPRWAGPEALALVTKGVAKIGGVGLALCMLDEFARLRGGQPGEVSVAVQGLQAYALEQIEGHDFLHKRRQSDGAVLPFRSDYYTGEALLGLFLTGCRDPRALSVLDAVVARRYGVAEHSHWMAYAACEAAQRGLAGPARLTGYLTDLIDTIIAEPGYRARRLSTPIACRSEALTRFLCACTEMPGRFPQALRARALQAAQENLHLQLQWYADGQFRKGDADATVQIDGIQHNASAFLNLWHSATPARRSD